VRTVEGKPCAICGRTRRWKHRNPNGIRPCAHCVKGVYPPLTSAELEEMRRRMPSGSYEEIRLFYALTASHGVLQRLYRAVLATPLEGTELRESMDQARKALGIST